MARALIIIPARMQASRLPGKPLADIAGKPMIVRVLERAQEADIGDVLVATDASEIVDAVTSAGGTAILTSPDHPSGSDRIHEAASAHGYDGIIINLQGDLPTIDPAAISNCANVLDNPSYDIATLANMIADDDDKIDPNVVKVVSSPQSDGTHNALYFTRATAPHGDGPLLHHIGIYAYRSEALKRFVALPPSPLEQRERLEQLRALEAGMRIGVAIVDSAPVGVDTPADLERVRAHFASFSNASPKSSPTSSKVS